MSNRYLMILSEGNHLKDSDEIPVFIGDPVLMRSEGGRWSPCIYMGYSEQGPDYFRSGEGWHEMMAPLPGNESAAGYDSDVYGLIDHDWMVERGLIETD